MCVCVFADSPEVTSAGLRHLSSLTGLGSLILTGVPASDIRSQESAGSWIRELPDSLCDLAIRGELRWHTHAVNGKTAGTDTLVMQLVRCTVAGENIWQYREDPAPR